MALPVHLAGGYCELAQPQLKNDGYRLKVVLVAGLWKYEDVDEKKSLGKLNVIYKEEDQKELLSIVGGDSIYGIGYKHNDVVVPLFKSSKETEPTLVSVALRRLIQPEFDVTEIPIAELLDNAALPSWNQQYRFHAEDVCLLSTSYVTNFRDLERLIGLVKNLGIHFIVGGGYLCTRNPEECLRRGLAAVIVGDAEEALPALLAHLNRPEYWASIPNLTYQERDKPVFTTSKLTNLNDIPVSVPEGDLSGMSIPYESMRGCPYHCGFCSYPLVSTKWRYKSADKVACDFLAIQQRRANNIIALDSTFTIPPSRLNAFLQLYVDRQIRIAWGAYSRVTPLKDEDMVRKLKAANNRWLSIGFESGSDRILQIMNKGTRVKDGYLALKNLRKHQISPWSNFIIGYPGETEETVEETVRFMKENIFGFYGIYVFNIRDRAMPVLSDSFANVHYEDIGGEWTHVTMDSRQASALRWESYLEVALNNMEAINIDVFRGTNVEKDYGAWSPAFPVLKDIELFMVWKACQHDGIRVESLDFDAVCQRLQRSLFPL